MAESVITACERGDADEVQRFIVFGHDLQNVKDSDGWTLLDIVVRYVVVCCVHFLKGTSFLLTRTQGKVYMFVNGFVVSRVSQTWL